MKKILFQLVLCLFCASTIKLSAQALDTDIPTPPQIVIPNPGHPEELLSKTDARQGQAMAFDSKNCPYILSIRKIGEYGKIYYIKDNVWAQYSYLDDIKKSGYGDGMTNNVKLPQGCHCFIAFDKQDALYIIVPQVKGGTSTGDMLLLYTSQVGAKPFHVYYLGSRHYLTALETTVNGNTLDTPPAIIKGKALSAKANLPGFAYLCKKPALYNVGPVTLSVVFPQKDGDSLLLSKQVVVDTETLGVDVSPLVTSGNKVFVAFAGYNTNYAQGCNPQYIAEIDKSTGTFVKKKLVGTVYPEQADNHCLPTIAIDSKGVVHYVSGNHAWNTQQPGFFYSRTTAPLNIDNWEKPIMMGIAQTYPSIAIDSNDNLVTTFRIHPGLCFQTSLDGMSWTSPATLASCSYDAFRPKHYTHFYQTMMVDRKGNFYAQFEYTDNSDGVDNNYPQVIVVSEDKGKTWKLATTALYVKYITGAPVMPETNNNGQVDGYGDGGGVK